MVNHHVRVGDITCYSNINAFYCIVYDLDTACYVCWETIYTNPRLAQPRSSTKTYKSIYTTIQNDTRPRFTTNTTGSEGMDEMAWLVAY